MVRLFVALSLPEEIQDRLGDLECGLPGVRWVPQDNLHLTLRFIGEVDGAQARDVDEALSAIHMPGFDLMLARVGTFGEGRKLRALWAGVEANPELMRLQAKIEQALIRSGLPPEARKYAPHVSLARLKNGTAVPPDKLQDFLRDNALFRAPPIQVEAFTLFSSFLSSSGAIYTPEADYPLDPVAARAAG